MLLRAFKYGKTNAVCRTLLSTLINKSFYNELINCGSLKGFVYALKTTPYAPFLSKPNRKSIIEGVENYFSALFKKLPPLLKTFYLKDRVKTLPEIRKIPELKRFAKSYGDLLDLFTIAKYLIIEKLPPSLVVTKLFCYGKVKNHLPDLLKAGSVQELSKSFPPIPTVNSITEFRKEVYRFHVKTLRKLLLGNPFNLSIPFVLVRLKEIEKKNLTAIAEGISENLKPKEIEEMLIDTS